MVNSYSKYSKPKRNDSSSMGPLPNWDSAASGKVPDYYSNKEYAVHKAAYQQQQNVPWINNPVEFPPLSQHQQQDIWGGIVDSQHYVQQSQQQAIQQNLNISSASSTLHPTSNSNYSQAQFQYFPMVYSQPVYSNAGIYDEEKAKLGNAGSTSTNAYYQPQYQYLPMTYPQAVVYPSTSPFDERKANILKQIESYFSPYYLSKDHSIVRFMDSDGWLPLIFLSGFPRVQEFTHDLRLIDQIVRNSKILELSSDGLKVRPRDLTSITPYLMQQAELIAE